LNPYNSKREETNTIAERFGITKNDAESIAQDISATIDDRWHYVAGTCGLSRGQIEAMSPAFTEKR